MVSCGSSNTMCVLMDYTLDFFSNKNEAMFGRKLSGVLGGVIFELDIL